MDKRIKVLATMAATLLTFPTEVRAADVPVPHISGGAGADAREAFLVREKEFNLKIVAADKSGGYLAGVRVVIESAKKAQVLDATMAGPILLTKLPPGAYTIRATSSGAPSAAPSSAFSPSLVSRGGGVSQPPSRQEI